MNRKFLGGGLLTLLTFGAGAVWLNYMMSQEIPVTVAFAFGNSSGEVIDMHIIVTMGMVATEGPERAPSGAVLWGEWVDEHIDVDRDDGERVQFRRSDFSKLISDQQAGVPEFFLHGKLRPGAAYTFDYIPRRDEPIRYRHTFTAPKNKQAVARPAFERIEG